MILDVQTPRVFVPLLGPQRYKGAKGGRGSGKSHFFAEQLVEEAVGQHIRAACLREVQISIKDSVKQLIEDKIDRLGVRHLFDSTETEIRGPNGSLFIFKGLQNHTANSIKSLEGFNRAWVEEAQTITQRSLDILTPTFRAPGSQMRFSWNAVKATDPVERMFAENEGDPDFVCVKANWYDNPWFPEELRKDMERDRARDPDKYQHVWGGNYLQSSEARVFRNWTVQEFETPSDAEFRFGADWGFATDPTVLIRGFIGRLENGQAVFDPTGRNLFIDQEAYKSGVEIDHIPALFDKIEGSRKWIITADSARPETVSYMRRQGFVIISALKGQGSLADGVEFLRSFDIVVHPRCQNAINELGLYSYKRDPLTDEILPVLEDKDNHVIDALRYALEALRRVRARKPAPKPSRNPPDLKSWRRQLDASSWRV